jgi:hypothetical protein
VRPGRGVDAFTEHPESRACDPSPSWGNAAHTFDTHGVSALCRSSPHARLRQASSSQANDPRPGVLLAKGQGNRMGSRYITRPRWREDKRLRSAPKRTREGGRRRSASGFLPGPEGPGGFAVQKTLNMGAQPSEKVPVKRWCEPEMAWLPGVWCSGSGGQTSPWNSECFQSSTSHARGMTRPSACRSPLPGRCRRFNPLGFSPGR